MQNKKDIIIIGGGAAGFFTAINIAFQKPNLNIAILERGAEVLQKVKVSGGGRCNVTHACFDPKELIQYYPRGGKELLGPFHQFCCGDVFEWFDNRGVSLKIEEDGRVFPSSNSSQTIIDCFLKEISKYNIEVMKNHSVLDFQPKQNQWEVMTKNITFTCDKLIVTAGSSPKVWKLLNGLGHTIVSPVPSLFTFKINDPRLNDIPGVVIKNVTVKVENSSLHSNGPLLITHWGMSAPAILKLSAYGARELAKMGYKFNIEINFTGLRFDFCLEQLRSLKKELAKNQVETYNQFEIPKRLWKKLVSASNILEGTRWADISKKQLEEFANQLTKAKFMVEGKSTFKEEFVTAGGINLKEINFKRFESKLYDNLFFAGEVLNIDAVTGGFNFQNAWTGGYVIAKSICEN